GQYAAQLRDVSRDDADRFARARELCEVADVDAAGARECDMLGDDIRAQLAGERREPPRAIEIDALGAAERELHAVGHDGPDLGDRRSFAPARALRVAGLGDDLDEVDGRRRGDEIRCELATKAEPDARLPRQRHPLETYTPAARRSRRD